MKDDEVGRIYNIYFRKFEKFYSVISKHNSKLKTALTTIFKDGQWLCE